MLQLFRSVAQLAERRSPKPKAVGSIPSTPAKLMNKILWDLLRKKAYGKSKSDKFYPPGSSRDWEGHLANSEGNNGHRYDGNNSLCVGCVVFLGGRWIHSFYCAAYSGIRINS